MLANVRTESVKGPVLLLQDEILEEQKKRPEAKTLFSSTSPKTADASTSPSRAQVSCMTS